MSSLLLPEFELLVPQSLKEAVEYLREYGKDVGVIAGGTDILIQMKSGLRFPYLLSLSEIPDLDYVDFNPSEGLRIGAMACMQKVTETPGIKEAYPGFWQATTQNGTPQTRNVATVVGNILRASPCGDCSCAILANGGTMVLESTEGRRELDIDEFWLDYMVTARQPNELAVEVKLPAPPENVVSAFIALNRTKQDLSKISAAVSMAMIGNTCQTGRIAMGSVAPIPLRLRETEKHLAGVEIDGKVMARIYESASSEIKPIDDVRSTAEYRRSVCGAVLEKAIKKAMNPSSN
jgi:carbon-monoxide dehydrogenase medium subunit